MVETPTWTAIGLGRELRIGGVSPSIVCGQELAVWRSATGIVRAWGNRCPHRGMRLSHGFVRGERLACLYHGWQYDGSGKCDYIPAHPDLTPPPSIRTMVHSCVEVGAFIWVGGDAQTVPDLPDGFGTGVRSLRIDATSDAVTAALMAGRVGDATACPHGLLALDAGILPCPTLAAVQDCGAFCVLLLAAPGGTDPDTLCAICDIAETFRRAVEQESVAP